MEKEIYNKEFKKEGWQQMNAILDQEMPVKKRRWIPIFLIFFILSSLGIGYSINKNNLTTNISTLDSKIKLKSIKQNSNNNNDQYTKSTIPVNRNDKNTKLKNKENKKTSTIKKQERKKIKSSKNIIKKNVTEYNTIASMEIQKEDLSVNNTNFKEVSVDNKLQLINSINSKNIRIIGTKELALFPKISLNFIDLSNNSKNLFNPYIELKTHLHNYKEFNPKFGIALGNRFDLSKKFFLNLEGSYSQPEIIIQSKDIVFDEIINNKGYSIKRNSNLSFNSDGGFLKSSVFDVSLYEGYKFNKRWNMQLGAGIAFTNKLNNYLSEYQSIDESDVQLGGESNGLSEINNSFKIKKYTWFADLKVSYSTHNHFRVNLGYKYYFKNYYILTQANSDLYRQEIINSIGNTGLYFGLQYQF